MKKYIFIFIIISLPFILLIFDKTLPKKDHNLSSYYIKNEDIKKMIEENGNKLITENINIIKYNEKKIENPKPSLDPRIWENEIREDMFSKTKLNGNGPLQYNTLRNKYINDPFDILIIGDSYSIGQFGDLNSYSYPYILEEKLNKYNNGNFRVTVLGAEKSSFLRQSDWVSLERLENLQPDLIILTYTMGRYIPTFYEKKYCKEYNICINDNQSALYNDAYNTKFSLSNRKYQIIACLQTNPGIISNIFRKILYPYYKNLAEHLVLFYCNKKRIEHASEKTIPSERTANYYKDPSKTIYYNDFLEYIEKIKNNVKIYNNNRAKLGKDKADINYINITMFPEHFENKYIKKYNLRQKSISDPLINNYAKNGISEIKTDHTVREIIKSKTWRLGLVTGSSKNGRCDYDCIITREPMEKNISNYLGGVINNPLRIRHGIKISNAIANDIYYHIIKKYSYKNEKINSGPLVKEFAPYFIAYKEIDKSNFILGNIHNSTQNNPCARINHPHFIFSLNHSQYIGTKSIIFSYLNGDINELGVAIEYFEKDKRVIKDTFLIEKNEKFSIKYNNNISSIYVYEKEKICKTDGNSMGNLTLMVSKK